MKKFKFKLQPLLDLRERKEKDVQGELAKLVSRQNVEKLKKETMLGQIDIEKKRFGEMMRKGSFDPRGALLFEKYVDIARKAVALTDDLITGMEPAIGEVRGRLMEARRDRLVVEKLKEKRYDEFLYAYNREIAKENDDMNQKLYMKQRAAYGEES